MNAAALADALLLVRRAGRPGRRSTSSTCDARTWRGRELAARRRVGQPIVPPVGTAAPDMAAMPPTLKKWSSEGCRPPLLRSRSGQASSLAGSGFEPPAEVAG